MARPKLFVMPQTRSGTVLWMNEELGGVCDIELVNLKAGNQKSQDYLAINPMGKVPALIHKGVAVSEAAAICATLADAFPDRGLAPALSDPKRGTYFRWMFFAPSCIEPMMLDKLSGHKRENAAAAGHGTEESVLASINHAIAENEYLLGDTFSAADVVFGSTLNFATMFGAIEKSGAIADYVDRVTARPAFGKMMEANAKYAADLGLS